MPRLGWESTKRITAFVVILSLLVMLLPLPNKRQNHAIIALQDNSNAPRECTHPPPDSCAFYGDCLESRYNCGPTGYPIGYGQKYCTKFRMARATLSPRGQTWMLATMHCLQEALIPDAVGDSSGTSTCEDLEHKAFATHAGCYVHSGVCQLPISDWRAVLVIVDFKTLFDSWDAFMATLKAGAECLEFYAFLVGQVERVI
ncbi:hypothetical protein C8R43DRAFT_1047231 [Mycena crocata]|nr:hypothetical protein C8R43DRAFT_1047231 [Mycena crocata]